MVVFEGRDDGRSIRNVLRPEFVKRFKLPLSSDAGSPFGKVDAHIHDAELQEATIYLQKTVIPSFAHSISTNATPIYSTANLIWEMHCEGINLRYLGLLRSLVRNPRVSRIILTEMVSRVITNRLRLKMRKNRNTCLCCADFLKSLFSSSNYANRFWTRILKLHIESKFGRYGQCLSAEELDLHFDIRYS